tara:strand:+ start:353 stop:460 length:108 start_codon:yes stop_codon:yes gene_type:complete
MLIIVIYFKKASITAFAKKIFPLTIEINEEGAVIK